MAVNVGELGSGSDMVKRKDIRHPKCRAIYTPVVSMHALDTHCSAFKNFFDPESCVRRVCVSDIHIW